MTMNFVQIYDNSTDISAQMQSVALIHTPQPAIELGMQQMGSTDCVFSIAYATGNNPAAYRYKQKLFRSHLETSLCNIQLFLQ